ncbi:MAG: sigma-70 family RNA polymerase sigma factor [Candidatus Omnitrophica bacterium]|nr:sigma-70 family RNA polymerase sigma factor [Candidatus Omnitrophota bacterium]
MNEDILCIERFLAGEEEGFEALVRKYQDRVLNIVYSLIGRDRESEDIAQEVFLKVYHHLSSFRQRSQFSTWLYRIVMNTTYDFLRKRRNYTSDEGAIKNSVALLEGPREAVLTKEKAEIIRKALGSIPLKFRAAVVLKDIEGLSYIDISKVLRCSIGTVESKIYRARQLLKTQLLKSEGGAI